jgi:SAM-dependent methyltransferase
MTISPAAPPADWYAHSFASDYLRLYRHRDDAEAARAVAALLALLELPPDARVLDLCCGFGRHLAVLRAHAGLRAVGADLSQPLLAEAARRGLGGALVRADMRRLPFRPGFDAVCSFFTSFGYFQDDAENLAALRELGRVLRPGGRFVLDYLNPDHVRRHLAPEDSRPLPEGGTVRQRRWLDEAARTVNKELQLTDAAGTRTWYESVKLYGPDDFARLCAAAGLAIDRVLGDYAAAPFAAASSPRQILLGHRLAAGQEAP